MAIIMEGKTLSQNLLKSAKQSVESLKQANKLVGLAVISVGNDPASKTYVYNKKKACEETGITFFHYELPETCTQEELEIVIDDMNCTPMVSGIILQLPVPAHLNADLAIKKIDPRKDVDGLSPLNAGCLALNKLYKGFVPCTANGIIDLLDHYAIQLSGKHVVIVGRSNLVGKPLAQLMLQRDATVTICHSFTNDLAAHTRQADIVVCAVGKPNLITADMVKDGSVVVDVGINRVNGKLCGDVDFENVKEKASHITPVPGGVGKMTVAELICNTIDAALTFEKQ